MDKELAKQAERLAKRSGMPMGPPPPIPPTEHIPAVDQQQQQPETTNVVHPKPMGAMKEQPPIATDGKDRRDDVNERLAWEQKHRDKSEFMNKMKDNAPRSALSARMTERKGGDPFLRGVVEGEGGLDPFSFADDKKELQNTMQEPNSASPSTADIASNMQQTVSSGETSTIPPPSSPGVRDMDIASAKSSEFIARAGSGDAFLGSVLGVGGLDDVLSQIQRRVWIPLAAPPSLLSELGIQPVRGLLLYG